MIGGPAPGRGRNGRPEEEERILNRKMCIRDRADLVLLERDPLTADPMSLRDIPVLATWKDGRLIYRREG